MICPLKFARYEFEGGETCIGAECGFFGGVCGSVDAHSKAQSKTELTLSEQPEPLSDESDSREKLEDDIQSDLAALSEYGKLMLDWYVVMDWLDRQAAITKAEQREWWGGVVAELQAKVDELTERKCPGYEPENHYCRYHAQDFELNSHTVSKLKREVAELTAELEARDKYPDGFVSHSEMMERVGELTEQLEAAHAKNRALKAHISKMQNGRHGWHVKGVELQRQVDELTAQLHVSNAERARLRGCLGTATDHAHDLLTLVDESGNVYDRDEGLA